MMRALILAALVLWCGSLAVPLRAPNTQKEQQGSTYSFSIKMDPPHPMFANPPPGTAPPAPATPAPAPVTAPTTPPPTPVPETETPAPPPKTKAPAKISAPKKTKATPGKNPSSIFTSFLEEQFPNSDDLSLYAFGTQFGNRR
ncbi:uncharacterized protein [Panulirus ornatus]|uniref:uncharacterized protein n=1 Tax=Panulirus ornatus TaxID=150431 RepID=UPI003A8883F7